MRLIIAGSRSIVDQATVDAALAAALPGWGGTLALDEVVSGGAPGVDQLGEAWARRHGLEVVRFPAEWKGFRNRSDGVRRNEEMVRYAAQRGGVLVAIWDGVSSDTRHIIRAAERAGLGVHVHRVGVGR